MRSLLWLVRSLVVPAVAVGLLGLWWQAALGRLDAGLSWWAALLLFGALGLSALLPRVAIGVLYGAFALQLVRPDARFDQAGWLPYAAVGLVAIVLAARTSDVRRRAHLVAILPLGLLIGLFTNLPDLGRAIWTDDGRVAPGTDGLVNGKAWASLTTFGGVELLVGLLVWSTGGILLIVAGWMIGSTWRARQLQWRAEAEAVAARAALIDSTYRLHVTEERDRIAQDVHDITAHSLSVIVAQADGAAAHATEPTTQGALTTIAGSARGALAELRGLLERLDRQTDGDTDHSVSEVAALVETVRATGADVDLEQHGDAVPLSQAAGLAAYRIVQEALTNALRHGARSGTVHVVLDWRADGLALTVASPAEPTALVELAGRGLIGMQQRARLAGGWLTSGFDGASASYLVTAYLPAQRAVVT